MKYDIVPIKNQYRGMGRCLLATDLYTRLSKYEYEHLLDMYYEYLLDVQQEPSQTGLMKLINFCTELNKFKIKCEVIVYDLCPLETIYGYVLYFLGIDIVHELSESLICECVDNEIQQFFNQYGLCNSELDANNIILLLDHGNVKWESCYVYKVKF